MGKHRKKDNSSSTSSSSTSSSSCSTSIKKLCISVNDKEISYCDRLSSEIIYIIVIPSCDGTDIKEICYCYRDMRVTLTTECESILYQINPYANGGGLFCTLRERINEVSPCDSICENDCFQKEFISGVAIYLSLYSLLLCPEFGNDLPFNFSLPFCEFTPHILSQSCFRYLSYPYQTILFCHRTSECKRSLFRLALEFINKWSIFFVPGPCLEEGKAITEIANSALNLLSMEIYRAESLRCELKELVKEIKESSSLTTSTSSSLTTSTVSTLSEDFGDSFTLTKNYPYQIAELM